MKKLLKNLLPYFLVNKLKGMKSYIHHWYLYGKEYRNTYNFLIKSEKWTTEQKKEYQLKKLKWLVSYCYENVPYYKNLFDKHNLSSNIKSFEDYEKIPFLTKQMIVENMNEFISKEFKINELELKTTGGSTGVALRFYKSKTDSEIEMAYVDFALYKMGLSHKKTYKKAIIRGDKPHTGISEKIGNTMVLSSYYLKKNYFPDYIKELELFQPELLHVYPSSISLIADYILQNNISINLKNLKGILASSEVFKDEQKEKVLKVFKVPICNLYGNTEHTVFGLEFYKQKNFDFNFSYGYTEIIDDEIVSTSFNDLAMPFLRYKTDDFVKIEDSQIIGIDGRGQDFIINKNKELISIAAINMHDDTFEGLVQYQFHQEEIGKVIIKIIIRDDKQFSINKMISNLSNKFDNKVDIDVKIVDTIERTERGKFKYLIQKIKVEDYK